MKKKVSNVLWQLALVAMAAVLGLVYYNFHDYFEPGADLVLPADPACDLRLGACKLPLPGNGSVSFSIEPRNIPVMKPLQLDVVVQGVEVVQVAVDFTGVDMNMGFNRSQLNREGAGHFAGEGTLPVCIRNRMDWEARVILQTPGGAIVAPFLFYSVK